jgi:hypothetical protein
VPREEVLKLVEDDLLRDERPQVLGVVKTPAPAAKPNLAAH